MARELRTNDKNGLIQESIKNGSQGKNLSVSFAKNDQARGQWSVSEANPQQQNNSIKKH